MVEDEKVYAEALIFKLERAGFVAESVSNGTDALAYLQTRKFDLVLLDLIMPGINGFTVMEKMKDLGITIPVFILSNSAQEADKQRVKDLGAKLFLEKSNITIVDVIKQVGLFLGV